MRIVITADLHYQPRHRAAMQEFAAWTARQQPDCFIVAGDVGHPLRLFRRGLALFDTLRCPRLVLAGNHDIYRGDQGSRRLWEKELPEAAQAAGFHWLESGSLRLGDLGICGTLAWYDYSSQAAHLDLGDSEYRLLKGMVNHDADFVDWPWSDRAMARYLTKTFVDRLNRLHADPAVARILVVTHMPIFKAAVPDYPESDFWSLLQAYMGNLTLGQAVRRYSKVTHVVSGHIHQPGRWLLEGEGGAIDFRLVGSKKGAPAAVVLTL